jgi:hypothetical protein
MFMQKGINMENARNNFRVSISMEPHILGKTNLDNLEVCLLDISAGGMGFQTTKMMEIGDTLAIAIDVLDRQYVMVGQIARRSIHSDMNHYGFQSFSSEMEMTPWVKLVNDMNFIQRKQPGKMKYLGCHCENV